MSSFDYDSLNKTLSDPILFINGLSEITLRDYQEQYINYITDKKLTLSLKARQLGFSEITAYYLLWEALRGSNRNIAIMASNTQTATRVIDTIRMLMVKNDILCDLFIRSNNNHIQLYNGSRIITVAATSNSLRGMSLNILYVDEIAYINDKLQRDIMYSYLPVAAASNTKIIITTSSSYKHSWVHECWTNNQSQFTKLLFTHNCYTFDKNWTNHVMTQLDDDSFRSEYLCEFIDKH